MSFYLASPPHVSPSLQTPPRSRNQTIKVTVFLWACAPAHPTRVERRCVSTQECAQCCLFLPEHWLGQGSSVLTALLRESKICSIPALRTLRSLQLSWGAQRVLAKEWIQPQLELGEFLFQVACKVSGVSQEHFPNSLSHSAPARHRSCISAFLQLSHDR